MISNHFDNVQITNKYSETLMTISVFRCFIPGLDTEISYKNATFDTEIITPYYAKKSNGDTDFCHWNNTVDGGEAAAGCNGRYVYSSEYYESSRVMEVRSWGTISVGSYLLKF